MAHSQVSGWCSQGIDWLMAPATRLAAVARLDLRDRKVHRGLSALMELPVPLVPPARMGRLGQPALKEVRAPMAQQGRQAPQDRRATPALMVRQARKVRRGFKGWLEIPGLPVQMGPTGLPARRESKGFRGSKVSKGCRAIPVPKAPKVRIAGRC